jgi:3-dehydroquinate synthase
MRKSETDLLLSVPEFDAKMNIALTGIMGAGKSSVGSKLAKYLRRKFIDLDSYIEKQEGRTVKEIFEVEGETYFRAVEKRALNEVFSNNNLVIALGGGSIVDTNNRDLIRKRSKLITLLADIDTISDRVEHKTHRPLLKGTDQKETLINLWESRKDAYMDTDLQVSTQNRSVDGIAKFIISELNLEEIAYGRLNVEIPRSSRSYDILFDDLLKINLKKLDLGRKVLILSQVGVPDQYLNRLKSVLAHHFEVHSLILEDGEKNKDFFNYQIIVQNLLSHKFERKDTVITLGGGVIGDMGGFAASTYHRGINYVQIPTTLLSMIDSSVGGKTGVNVPEGKNLVGSFYQPNLVFIDVAHLETLPDKEFKSGLGELIKYALLGHQWDSLIVEDEDDSFFNYIDRNHKAIMSRDPETLSKIIRHCLQIKTNIVINDERESGIRMHLNLGHTFGHALEEATNYERYSHGEAVAIGIICSCYLAEQIDIFSPILTNKVIELMKSFDMEYQIPEDIDINDLIIAMKHDKKVEQGQLKFILPRERIGSVSTIKDIAPKLVKKALKRNQKDLSSCNKDR